MTSLVKVSHAHGDIYIRPEHVTYVFQKMWTDMNKNVSTCLCVSFLDDPEYLELKGVELEDFLKLI